MLKGVLFDPRSLALVEDRGRCRTALFRFNNAGNPLYGIDKKERARLFDDLIRPSSDEIESPNGPPSPKGSTGPGVVVETPFRCLYGYNINLGEDVYIGENCNIVDCCTVHIGAKTWIGPDVTILGGMAHSDMHSRAGTKSRWQGGRVTIEMDCWIGARVTIYPGVTIRRGAFVEPGSVVRTDVEQYGNVGLKPRYME